ncbi:MAG: hypothetical protein J5726_03515 [Treponema sp.]|nr:hypothetical protein [Treponema sp.]
MKKLLVTVAAILAIALLTGCPGAPKDTDDAGGNSGSGSGSGTGNNGNGSGGGSGSGTATPTRTKATNKFGEWEGVYEVGDIVFSDGSATPYSNTLSLSDAQKGAAIAIIFYKGTALNNPGVSKTRTLGMGICQSPGPIDWCTAEANAKNLKILTTEVNVRYYSTDSSSKNDGSNNFARIGEFLVNPDKRYDPQEDDTGNPDLYPVFYFAKNYKTYEGSHVAESSFENGWYIPSIAELKELWKSFTTVKAANTLCGGTEFRIRDDGDNILWYWSSSYTNDCDEQSAATINLEDGDASAHKKSLSTSQYYAPKIYGLVIREF